MLAKKGPGGAGTPLPRCHLLCHLLCHCPPKACFQLTPVLKLSRCQGAAWTSRLKNQIQSWCPADFVTQNRSCKGNCLSSPWLPTTLWLQVQMRRDWVINTGPPDSFILQLSCEKCISEHLKFVLNSSLFLYWGEVHSLCRSQRATCRGQPSTMWVLGIELRPSGLVADTFTC